MIIFLKFGVLFGNVIFILCFDQLSFSSSSAIPTHNFPLNFIHLVFNPMNLFSEAHIQNHLPEDVEPLLNHIPEENWLLLYR